MKFILGKKIEMSQVFDTNGKVHPVTWVYAGPLMVTGIRTQEQDGYDAVQVGFELKSKKSIHKSQKGYFREIAVPRVVKEFRGSFELKRGDTITVSQFKTGEKVLVSGTTKGKGFQGVVKRHGFAGGPRTHGQKHSEREPGSIGAVWPQRVLKGTRMAGRMGGNRVTVRNLTVIEVLAEKNLIGLKGALPGHRGALVEVRSTE